ncbi:DUF6119 family protein [Glycomyces sp. NPDC047369]
MAPLESQSVRTTLYRMHGATNLVAFIRSKYLEAGAFIDEPCVIGDREALLVQGTIKTPEAKWSRRVSTISGIQVGLGNESAAAVVLVRDGDDMAWALTFGMGFQLLSQAHIDSGFGIRVATRSASPEAIQSLTKNELDHRARTDRSSIPAGESLWAFGIEDFGEIVTKLSGSARIAGLTTGDKTVKIRAADALSIPLGKKPDDLMRDLDSISAVLASDPKPELGSLEQFSRVKHSDIIDNLNYALISAIRDRGNTARLALGWPHERVSENGTPESFRIVGNGVRNPEVIEDLPTLDHILDAVMGKGHLDPVEAAKRVKILLFRDGDGEEAVSGAIPALNWLTFETELNGTRYCLFDSKWYSMDSDYGDRLQNAIDRIFERPAVVNMPFWDRRKHSREKTYNDEVAPLVPGVSLDQKLIRTSAHKRGFEACDILTHKGDYVHVKHVPKSDAASHLIAQVIVSVDALLHDGEAVSELRKVAIRSGAPEKIIPERPKSVVLVMAREKIITSSDLFSFTKVTLARLDRMLTGRGINLTIAPVGYRPKAIAEA